jgi:hypothetical protein
MYQMSHVEFGYGDDQVGFVESGADPYAAGADPYAAGAAAVDEVMSGLQRMNPRQLAALRQHQSALRGLNRLQAPFVGSATGKPFVYEGGVVSTPLTAAAPQGTATKHANIAFRIIDWMVGNPTFVSGGITFEAFLITSILNGETPMLMGSGGIFGSSHGPQVWQRGVGYTTTQSGWDFVWNITAQNLAAWAAISLTSIQCFFSFHYESHRRL